MSISVLYTEHGAMRRIGDGSWELRCPDCGRWGELDDDQLHGRVSVDHTEQRFVFGRAWRRCTYHETHDFAAALP